MSAEQHHYRSGVPDFSKRLNEADAMFVAVSDAGGVPYAPVTVGIAERALPEEARQHMTEVRMRILPAMRRRIVKDRLSTALPRWVDVPGFDPQDNVLHLPPPGDGSMRAILDWAARWGQQPFAPDRPPWRAVYFDDVVVDGVPGRVVMVTQFHHSIIDGQGSRRLGERIVQYEPDAPLPEMPPPVPPDTSTAWDRWTEGWAQEAHKLGEGLRNTSTRLRWAARNPRAGARRAADLTRAVRRMTSHQGTTGQSSLLRRKSDEMRFDWLDIDFAGLKAGAKAVGGTVNDGFMAALSVGLHRYHRDRGAIAGSLRTAMAINTRTDKHGATGNEVIGVMLALPLLDDPVAAIKACGEVSREHRQDKDVLFVIDRFRALANRLPKRIVVPMTKKMMTGVDLQISNVAGNPRQTYTAGVANLGGVALPVGGLNALAITMASRADRATVGVVSDRTATSWSSGSRRGSRRSPRSLGDSCSPSVTRVTRTARAF
jgi:diacylglycerol O-acyltransferase